MNTYWLFGLPATPSLQSDAGMIHYVMEVQAWSLAEAASLTAAITTIGIGAPVPDRVTVHSFVSMVPSPSGVRLISALPESLTAWSLDLNRGSFHTDLMGSEVMTYSIRGWDAVEVDIPISALSLGSAPETTYLNSGIIEYSTASSPGVKKAILSLESTY